VAEEGAANTAPDPPETAKMPRPATTPTATEVTQRGPRARRTRTRRRGVVGEEASAV